MALYEKIMAKIKRITPVALLYKYYKYVISGYLIYKRLIKKYGQDVTILFCPFEGTGDAYIVGAYLQEYIQQNHINNYVVLEPLPAGTKVLKLFGDIPLETLTIEERNHFRTFMTFVQPTIKNIHLMHFNSWSNTAINGYVEGINGLSFIELFRDIGLKVQTYRTPNYGDNQGWVQEVMEKYNLVPGKTVLVAPYAGTIEQLPDYFWMEIIDELSRNGYKIVINSSEKNLPVGDGIPSILVPYAHLVPFLDQCGYFIGYRSGLCEVISASTCKKIVVYPEKMAWGCSVFSSYFSLKKMPFYGNVLECEINARNPHTTSKWILKEFGLIPEYYSEAKSGVITPVFSNNFVAISMAASNEYAPYLSVTLQSILEHASWERNYDIIVLSGGISDNNKALLQRQIGRHPNVSLRFVEVMQFLKQYNLFSRDWYHPIIYARLMLPELMKEYEKVLYLDSDVVATVDVAELYDLDINGYLVGAVRDVGQTAVYKDNVPYVTNYINEYLKLKNPFGYINSGVVLFNILPFRKNFSIEFLFDYATSRHWEWQDQDIFMTLFEGNIYIIEQKWNYLCRWFCNDKDMVERSAPFEFYQEFMNARENPKIAHFIVNSFREENPQADWNELFWKYAKKTPYYELILSRTMGYRLKR